MKERKEFALMSITSLLTGVEAAHFFSAKLPSTMTIQSFVSTKESYDAIIDGLVKANIGSAVLAGVITVASKAAAIKFWWLPGVATAGMCAFLTWSYLDDLKNAPFIANGTSTSASLQNNVNSGKLTGGIHFN